jgi:signal recognition particle subunit SRP54
MIALELVVEFSDRGPQVGCGAHGTQGVVVVGYRDAEDCHRGVTDELLHRSTVALERRARRVEVALLDPAVNLRIDLLAERRRSDDVAEDDGNRLSGGHVPSLGRRGRISTLFGRMFDTLGDKLNAALGPLRGRGKLDEEVISRAMREIRLALLEADVNLKVVKDFVARVKERATGQDVARSLTPGQQVVKIVHEELTELMGAGSSKLAIAGKPPTVILLAGLQGSGKTTAAAKLALLLRKENHTPALVAADLQRPAAVEQLQQLGRQIQVPVSTGPDPVKAVTEGIQRAKDQGADVVILDTAGRLHVDEELMDELARVRDAAKPTNVLLVLDAMTGQEAVSVAEAFQERVAFDGVILTKLDGDARGGAALSVKAVTGKPIKLASVGEKLDQLEYFHPDRMASRILGMGDVLTLIEKAEEAASEEDQADLEARMRAGEFSFDDFLASYRMLRKMGPLKGVMSMIPGLGKQLQGLDVNEAELKRVEAIVLSMTPQERRLPHVIDGSRRKRIAAGSGTTIQQVNKLLSARKQMQKMMKQMGKGKMPGLPPELTNAPRR